MADENSTNQSSSLCIVCSRNQRSIVFIPCAHLSACVICAHGLSSCPTCRSEIKAFLKIYQ